MARIKLEEISTRAPEHLKKEIVKEETATIVAKLNELQNLLYAEGKHSILVILQGMDASGKDGLIRNVFGKMNPQGVTVHSFKVPTAEELGHDFLWRVHKQAPARGMIQLFNRSHYEDILITRVHNLCDKDTAVKRMRAINDFEWLLTEHNDTVILKFYLHISEKEQAERLQERLDNPAKQWKYNEGDLKEAKFWPEYRKMYEDCFEECNKVSWTIVPADQNWYKEFIVAQKLYEVLSGLKMRYPGLKK